MAAYKPRVRWHATKGWCVALSWVSEPENSPTMRALTMAGELNKVNNVFPMLAARKRADWLRAP